jgi:hypothetical protein
VEQIDRHLNVGVDADRHQKPGDGSERRDGRENGPEVESRDLE